MRRQVDPVVTPSVRAFETAPAQTAGASVAIEQVGLMRTRRECVADSRPAVASCGERPASCPR